jgi:plasmid maintenance system antidote protein VapI
MKQPVTDRPLKGVKKYERHPLRVLFQSEITKQGRIVRVAAKAIGVKEATLKQSINGWRPFNRPTAIALARFLGIPEHIVDAILKENGM